MRATLTFNLPEESQEHQHAINAIGYYCALTDMDDYLRSRLKNEDMSPEVHEALQEARDHLIALRADAETP